MTQGKFWSVLCILDERVIDGNSYYLIQWEGNDKNGNPWTPTWEPGENCTQSLINDWKMRRLETNQDYRCHRENSVISDSTVTDGSDHRCSDVLALWDEISIKGNNNSSESSIVDQKMHDNSNIISFDSQHLLKRSQIECQSENSVGEKEIVHHTNKKNRTHESFISKECCFTFDKNNNCSYQGSFAQQTDSFELESCISQIPLSPQYIPTQFSVSTEQGGNNLNDKKILPNQPFHYQTQISQDESLQTVLSLASNDTGCTSGSSDLNSNLSFKDPMLLMKALQNKTDAIAIMCEERDRFQKTISQIKRNWQLQQEKAINLSIENEQIKQKLQQKTNEYDNIRLQCLFYQQTIQQLQECHNEKGIQHSLELEESKRKYEIIRQNDSRVIEELERSTKSVIAENQKLKQELENIKSFNANMENMKKSTQNLMAIGNQDLSIKDSSLSNTEKTCLSSNKLQKSSTVKLSLNYETLISENKRLESDIKALNLQNMLQQQNIKLMEEKLLQNDSTLRFFMDLQQVHKVGK
ncbi:12157_t:CDS:2 [Cetraspora pellucida]|uniref:12157_t:CDS:1 n=1 Tax=Cetraspora pellucida TaxID=1433469 RepID=A0A9N9N188_9GLOM|nr:12157_t:CDS:2 [Cetraspora pellucida]